jgi:hypothetical protein
MENNKTGFWKDQMQKTVPNMTQNLLFQLSGLKDKELNKFNKKRNDLMSLNNTYKNNMNNREYLLNINLNDYKKHYEIDKQLYDKFIFEYNDYKNEHNEIINKINKKNLKVHKKLIYLVT